MNRLKKLFTVRRVLMLLLIISVIFAAVSIKRKVEVWGFTFDPGSVTRVWTLEARIDFEADDDLVRASLAVPVSSPGFQIESVPAVSDGYSFALEKDTGTNGTGRAIWSSFTEREDDQRLFYRLLVYDAPGVALAEKADGAVLARVDLSESQRAAAESLLERVKNRGGDIPSGVLKELNSSTPGAEVELLLPGRKSAEALCRTAGQVLSLAGIPSRTSIGLQLEDQRNFLMPELRLEAVVDGEWHIYDPNSGENGLRRGFLLFRRGGESLLDLEGGHDGRVRFSASNSAVGSFALSPRRVLGERLDESLFHYSLYSLPLNEQAAFRWLSIIPLSILIVVVLRNMVGLQTMGTFAPILLALALVETGLLAGLILFAVIIALGLGLRNGLSRLNLLLVPRIAAVVIAVILIMEIVAVLSVRFGFGSGSASAAFPIIIMAWIIERAAIIVEEDGIRNALRQMFMTLAVTLAVYFIVSNVYVRHIMYVFNELNICIMILVMLIGTYSGYRLTELRRFRELVK